MNTRGKFLEEALTQQLAKLLYSIPWLKEISFEQQPKGIRGGFDLRVRFHASRKVKCELLVEIKSEPRPSRFPYANIDRESAPERGSLTRVFVLGTPHISPRMAEVCEKYGWSWFDLAGNCRISIPEILHLERRGNPPVYFAPKPKANLGTHEAGRVIRTLLVPSNAARVWTQRSLQKECYPKVSLGLVNKVVTYLQEEGFVAPLKGGGFRLHDPMQLLFAWKDLYRFDLHQQRHYFTLKKGDKLRIALANLAAKTDHICHAAFSAADFQAPYVRQPKTWIYITQQGLQYLQPVVEAKPVESGENLVVLVPADDGVFYQLEGNDNIYHLPYTNPVQTYIDLWHCGGRGQEAAEAILEQCLKPRWKMAGLPV